MCWETCDAPGRKTLGEGLVLTSAVAQLREPVVDLHVDE